ncbi:MAG: LCP family protein [Propionibacteriaceae bacterium]|nr:LCP family protein [Propionibacteriaceae bacterium]
MTDIFDDIREDEAPGFPRVSLAIAGVVGLSSVVVIVVLLLMGVLPTSALLSIIVIELVFACVLAFVLLRSRPQIHKVRFTMATMMAFLLFVSNCAMVKVGVDYLRFSSNIQAPTTETVAYDIVALSSASLELSDLSGSFMAEVGSDPLGQAVRDEVVKLVEVDFTPSPTWVNMVEEVISGEIRSMVIQDALMQVLEDADEESYDKLVILATVDVDANWVAPPPAPPTQQPDQPYVVYISGIDTYGSISSRSRSDVNMLMVVNPESGQILLVNTPRDFYVQFRGTTGLRDKLTHAGVYGIGVSIGTMEDLYDIDIDYYLRLNFSSTITVVDALGGIDVDSAYAFSQNGYKFTVGMNHLDGEAALAFCRNRYSFSGGDRVRGENQQRVIVGIIHRLTDPSVLARYDRILSAVEGSVETSMPRSAISAQVKTQLSSGQDWDIETISVDGVGAMDYTYTYPGQRLYVMVPNQATVDTAKQKIRQTLGG